MSEATVTHGELVLYGKDGEIDRIPMTLEQLKALTILFNQGMKLADFVRGLVEAAK